MVNKDCQKQKNPIVQIFKVTFLMKKVNLGPAEQSHFGLFEYLFLQFESCFVQQPILELILAPGVINFLKLETQLLEVQIMPEIQIQCCQLTLNCKKYQIRVLSIIVSVYHRKNSELKKNEIIIQQGRLARMSKKGKTVGNNKSILQFLKSTAPPPLAESSNSLPAPATPATEKRKIVGNLESFIIKKPAVKAPVPSVILYPARQLIDKLTPQQLFPQVPALQQFAQQLSQHTTHKQCVRSLIFSFLRGRKHQLWNLKYSPSNLRGVFPSSTVDQIRRWLNQFSTSMSDAEMSDGDFICDGIQSDRRNRLKSCQQKALILYGREGIGKMTLLKCIAETMGMEPHICSNEQDRFKYLKEKDQSTKSECVKNRRRCPTPSVLLTNFFPKKQDQSETQTQPPSVQIIHQINLIYPCDKKTKFHQDLIRLMHQSMVPFIFTSSVQSIPSEYKEFQKVEYKELTKRDLAELFWLVWHIEWAMEGRSMDKGIEKESLMQVVNREMDGVRFEEVVTLKEIEEIVQILDFKLDPVFSLLQFHFILKTRDFREVKKQALTNIICSADKASGQKIVHNIPTQHYTNNLTQIYTLAPPRTQIHPQQSAQDLSKQQSTTNQDNPQPQSQPLLSHLAHLSHLITEDQLTNSIPTKINPFYHRNWLTPRTADLQDLDIKQHYPMYNLSYNSGRSQHMSVKTKLANRINASIINSSQVHSRMRVEELGVIRPERTRNQRRGTKQLLEEVVGADYARYLAAFARSE